MAALAELKHEWRQFRDDPPGERFQNHHERMQRGPKAYAVARTVIGVALLAAGIVLLFIPGPGLLVMVFGLALFAGQSRRLARLLDRAEQPVRDRVHAARRRWRELPRIAKLGVLALAGAAGIAALYAMWWLWSG